MRMRREPPVQIKTPAQIGLMREAGLVVARALDAAVAAVAPGVSTAELDAIAEQVIRDAGAVPSFLGYHGFPATICASVNDEIVHGIPAAGRKLAAGDLISIDCGAILAGWHGDAARTVPVGEVSPEVAQLIEDCDRALWQGLAQARAGARLSDISHAIEQSALAAGPYGIVAEYTGHGIGTEMHQDPQVPNYRVRDRGPIVRSGVTVAIEPMVTLGSAETDVLDDEWTVVTQDGSRAAHWENSVAVTDAGLWVLTALDGGEQRLKSLGAAYAPQD